jgi:type I restriction enzyme S subunit
MSVENKVPEIRFKGFRDEWEKYPLATFISSLDAGVSVNSGDRIANENEFGILKTSCVTNGFFEPKENKIVFKTKEITRLKEPVLENTIIISRMNTPALVGANAYISRGYVNYFLPDRLWAAKPTSTGNLKFIAYILGSDKGRLALSDLATGTSGSMKNISKPAVLRLELCAPKETEQTSIGNYFQKLDTLINQHQQKYGKLNNIKKAMLEKMFPKQGETIPEIRFKGFSGEWVERSWSDTVDISTNMVDPRNCQYGELFHVGPGNIESFTGRFYNNVLKVKDSNLISGKFHFNKGDIIYGKINPQLAKYVIAPFEGLASADAYVLNTKNGVAQNYLFAILHTEDFYKYTVSVSSRTGMPKINRDELNIYSYMAPSESEQTQIGNYFQKLDALINQHQQQITKLNNIKQACLSKMFV